MAGGPMPYRATVRFREVEDIHFLDLPFRVGQDGFSPLLAGSSATQRLVDSFGGRRGSLEFLVWPPGPRHEFAAAIRAKAVELLCARRTKGALE
jgi:hypothetical protein